MHTCILLIWEPLRFAYFFPLTHKGHLDRIAQGVTAEDILDACCYSLGYTVQMTFVGKGEEISKSQWLSNQQYAGENRILFTNYIKLNETEGTQYFNLSHFGFNFKNIFCGHQRNFLELSQ